MQLKSQEDSAPRVRWMETILQTNLNWGRNTVLSFFFSRGIAEIFLNYRLFRWQNCNLSFSCNLTYVHTFAISNFLLHSNCLLLSPVMRASLGINSSCLSAPGYQHTWGCRERDSVSVHTVYLRHYPAITFPGLLSPRCLLFIPLCICDFSMFY